VPTSLALADTVARSDTLRTNDFDEIAQTFPAWDATFRQMQGGRFCGSLTDVRVGGVGVSRITLSHTCQLRGVLRRPGYIFSPVLGGNSRAVWRGRRLRPGQLNLIGSGTVIDHLSAPEADYPMISIDRDRLRELGGVLFGSDIEGYLCERLAVRPTPASFTHLLSHMRTVLDRSPDSAEQAEAELVRHLVQSVVSSDPALEETPSSASRLQIVRRAEEFIFANLARPVTILALCRELDVSERTLQYAFRDRFGMTPKAYLKAHRLNAVRRELKAADPTTATVHEIANRWTMTHPGEFAADYRQHFGELPSDTLAGR
jgi:AraC family ethanolamine operon transcriptional activator